VVAASSTGVRLAGFLAALSSGVFFDLFLTQPYGTLAVSNPDDVEALVLLLAVGLAVTELALWGRRQQAGASRRLGYLDGVLSTAEKIAAQDPDPADLVALVGTELTGLLGLDGCRYAPVAPHLRVVVQPDGQVRSGERLLDVERHGLPTDEEILLPIRSEGQTVGGFVLTSATRAQHPTREQLRVAVLLADQAGTVLHTADDSRGTVRAEGRKPSRHRPIGRRVSVRGAAVALQQRAVPRLGWMAPFKMRLSRNRRRSDRLPTRPLMACR
jgi:K+-sensing histidine kinase KdpD